MQMVALSRVLLGSPGLVLLDEPSQGLAPRMVQQVVSVIRKLQDEGSRCSSSSRTRSPRSRWPTASMSWTRKVVHQGPAPELLKDTPLRTKLLGV